MKKQACFIAFLLFITISCSQQPDQEDAFSSLFDGTTYTGWEGSKEYFRIEDQSIVAGTLDTIIPLNQFLCTEASFSNFELRLKTKFTARDNNAGIQFRTARIPDHHEVIGYQCDVGYMPGRPIWASLYDESRRKRFLVEPPVEKVEAVLRPDDWNDFRIRCEGAAIKIWLNERLMVDYTESDQSVPAKGIICLQIHSGPPAEAWYRDIQLMTLD